MPPPPTHHKLPSLPTDLLLLLTKHLHNIEDYNNLRSTCRTLREALELTSPNTILRLAAAQENVFFRPSPHFLAAATARQLGDWIRQSDANEAQFCSSVREGMEGLFSLSLRHCGLTMERIRELHLMRFSTVNPVTNIIDQCVGKQWYDVPDFWDGGRSDAYTIEADPPQTFFHLAIYGDLFGPDLDTYLRGDTARKMLRVETRLEFVKYCLTDFATLCVEWYGEGPDPRRAVNPAGFYEEIDEDNVNRHNNFGHDHTLALTWTLKSSRWLPHWKAIRQLAGPDWEEEFRDGWWFDEGDNRDWRQRLWENVMICQGLEGLKMISPCLTSTEKDKFIARIKDWRDKISNLQREDEPVRVVRQATHRWPYLMGDLRICASGFVAGT